MADNVIARGGIGDLVYTSGLNLLSQSKFCFSLPFQIKEKVRTMKRMYRELLLEAEELGETSFDELAAKWVHYKDMHEIMTWEPAEAEGEGEEEEETMESEMEETAKPQKSKKIFYTISSF